MAHTKISEIRKRDGRIVRFEPKKITNAIHKAVVAVGEEDRDVAETLSEQVVEIMEGRFVEKIPTVEDVQDLVEEVLIKNGHVNVARAYILYRQKRTELREAKKFYGVSDDLKLGVNAIKVLERRYLLKDEKLRVIETPAEMFRRVAKAIALVDGIYDKGADVKKVEEEFYRIMANLEFLPNSPTLMNAGTDVGQLSACFVLPVLDSMEGIFDALKYMALVHKSGGGTGFSFSRLRPKGDIVKSTKGVASGPVSFMRAFDMSTEIIKQGGCISTKSLIRTDKGVVPLGRLLDCPSFGSNPTRYLVYTNGSFHSAFLAEDNGIAEVFYIKTTIGTEIKATYNHQICVVDGEGRFSWKEAGKIQKGEWLVHVLGGHSGEDVELPDLGGQHFNANPIKIPTTMNPELAELLGIYMTDGCTSTGGRIIFCIEDCDVELKERIERLMLKLFGLSLGVEQKKEEDNSTCLIFYSRDLCRFFKKAGWEKENAFNAFVPPKIFESSRASSYAFLRGLFEGDGDVHPDGYPRLYSVSERLVKEVQQLLFSLNIVSSFHKYEGKNRFGNNPVFQLLIVPERSVNSFIKKIGFITKKKNLRLGKWKPKKFERFDVIPNQGKLLRRLYNGPGRGCGKNRSKRGANRKLYRAIQHYIGGIRQTSKRNLTRKRLRWLLQNFKELRCDQLLKIVSEEYFYSQVSEITQQKEYTMDIMVPATGQFVANSILVHNKRRGANMGILRVDHPDILEFIPAKGEEGLLTNFNVSVAITDEFMHAVENDEKYDLINPRTGDAVKRLPAKDVFDLIAITAWKTGDPGIIFIDEINRHNPTPKLGKIESTNPCGEMPLLPYESCNLGSINLAKMIAFKDGKAEIDFDKLRKTTRTAVHFLDNVIDANKYPLSQIEEMTKANRKIGLGVMGFAQMLIELEIPYDSKKALNMAEKVMKFISEEARKKSVEMGKERGSFPNFNDSIWKKEGYDAMRNAAITTIAPTGTISIIGNTTSGIEPLFAVSFFRSVMEGTRLLEVNPAFERIAKERGFYSKELLRKIARTGSIKGMEGIPEDVERVFITALDISPEWHVRMQAAFQKYVDSAVSKTVNLPNDASLEDVKKIFLLAYELKCKGITVYRYGSKKEQVLYIGPISEAEGEGYLEAESDFAGGCPTEVCPL